MKKILTVLIISMISLVCILPVMAQVDTDADSKIDPIDISKWLELMPNLSPGAFYSAQDKVVKTTVTTPLIKDIFIPGLNIEVGAAPVDDMFLAGVSYELIKLKDYMDIPILDLIEINVGYAVGVESLFNRNEFHNGPWATAIKMKF